MLLVILILLHLYRGTLLKTDKMLDKEKYIKGYYVNKDVCDLIQFLESNLNLQEWNCQSVNMWTIVRNDLASTILKSRTKRSVSSLPILINTLPRKEYIVFKFFGIAKDILLGIWQILTVILCNILKDSTVLLVGDGRSKSLVSDKWADKFLDPLRFYYDKKNVHTVFLDVNKFQNKPLYSKVFNIDKIEKTSYFFARLYFFLNKKNVINSAEILLFKKNLEKFELDTNDYTAENLTLNYYKILILHFFFKIILIIFKVKKIYIVAYYNIYGYALCFAANKLNIKVIDIQHGILENHPAYQFFGDVESKNNLLPSLFWVWDRHSHQIFRKNNAPGFLRYHKSFPGGISWALWSKQISLQENLYCKNLFDSNKMHILVTMQPEVYGRDLWAKLLPIIKKYNKYHWWVRKHPAFYNDCNQLDELDNSHYAHVNFLDAYRVPIYTLFAHCDLHITTDSSSALDAEKFNVTTLFLSDLCYQFFPHLIEQKKGVYFEHVVDIENYIVSLLDVMHPEI